MVRTYLGGELARSHAFCKKLADHNYIIEPTGPDAAVQNSSVERFNGSFAEITRSLLYGAGLPAIYCSSALVHAAFLLNLRCHSRTKKTPFESWNGKRPNLKRLKTFGSRVCVKQSGDRRSKLDKHDFTGIFIESTSTDRNIRYIDVTTTAVKNATHAVFDEAW